MARRTARKLAQRLFADGHDPILHNHLKRLSDHVNNLSTMTREFFNQAKDPRRSINDECGYPATESLSPRDYQQLYERNEIAARVVEILPKESWQVVPEVYEAERGQVTTPFEQDWDALGRGLRSVGGQSWYAEEKGSPVWEHLIRADILSGIGQYGAVLLGLDDGLDLKEAVAGVVEQGSSPVDSVVDDKGRVAGYQPSANGSAKHQRYSLTTNADEVAGRKLLYLRAFPESLCRITRFESNPKSPRYGQPTAYHVTFNDPNQTYAAVGAPQGGREVHWTRVIHVADVNHTASCSEVFAIPRCRPVMNRLLDAEKVYGADGEAYWRNAIMKLFFETHPQLGGDVTVDSDEFSDFMEEMMNGLQQWGLLKGMSAKAIAPSVSDPSPHIASIIQAICVKGAYPQRVFMGSERGELASSQDDAAWNDRLRQRQNGYNSPRLVAPFVNRLIVVGVLRPPQSGFRVWWPDIASQTDQERANVSATKTQALVSYINGNGPALIEPFDYLTRWLGFTDEEAEAQLEATVGVSEESPGEGLLEDEQEEQDADAQPETTPQPPEAGPDADGAAAQAPPG